jgi:hypothetical protein
MALAGRSALVGVRDRVRTRNASCTPRLVHVSADGVSAAQLLTCNRAICRFLPFRALRCAARKWPVYRNFAMARPGLEPGTPRFSAVVSSRRPGWAPVRAAAPIRREQHSARLALATAWNHAGAGASDRFGGLCFAHQSRRELAAQRDSRCSSGAGVSPALVETPACQRSRGRFGARRSSTAARIRR